MHLDKHCFKEPVKVTWITVPAHESTDCGDRDREALLTGRDKKCLPRNAGDKDPAVCARNIQAHTSECLLLVKRHPDECFSLLEL